MSELRESRWAVISERGCEAKSLPYADAAQLVGRLRAERVSGLCVVTDFAASRLQRATSPAPNGQPKTKKAPAARRRRAVKTS
ncbi:MAG TPA: hypothetical protein VFX96_10885 [Pyrinomonadaceae bacterium]|nr:hypothetical protein [Pyrinomonadaceae bacterium]